MKRSLPTVRSWSIAGVVTSSKVKRRAAIRSWPTSRSRTARARWKCSASPARWRRAAATSEGRTILASGRLSVRDEGPQLMCDSARPLDGSAADVSAGAAGERQTLYLRLPSMDSHEMTQFRRIAYLFEGKEPVRIRLIDSGKLIGTTAALHPAFCPRNARAARRRECSAEIKRRRKFPCVCKARSLLCPTPCWTAVPLRPGADGALHSENGERGRRHGARPRRSAGVAAFGGDRGRLPRSLTEREAGCAVCSGTMLEKGHAAAAVAEGGYRGLYRYARARGDGEEGGLPRGRCRRRGRGRRVAADVRSPTTSCRTTRTGSGWNKNGIREKEDGCVLLFPSLFLFSLGASKSALITLA